MTFNRDFFVAVFFLVLSVGMFVTSYSLPKPMFDQLPSWTWPRVILVPLGLLSLVLMVQSQFNGEEPVDLASLGRWLRQNVNPFICFFLFFLFLFFMPILGMLIGGVLYVFLTLSVLGGWRPRQIALHAGIAVVFVAGMWAVFSLLLGVVLPEGTILRVY